MSKLVASVYVTYGKYDGAELMERIVIEDTKEGREEVLDLVGYDDLYPSEERFIEGELYDATFDRHGGDWDEPTGGFFELRTKEDLLDGAKAKYNAEVKSIELLFGGDC